MKLIAEFNEQNVQCIVEKNEQGEKSYVIEGVFAQAEQKNRNGRIYPKKTMERAVNKYVEEQVSKNRAVGELNHQKVQQSTSTKFRISSLIFVSKAMM